MLRGASVDLIPTVLDRGGLGGGPRPPPSTLAVRRLRAVRPRQAAVTGAEALTRAGAGAVTDGADRAEADAFAATAAAFADAGEAEAAGAERLADLIAPHVAARAQRIVAERIVT